MKRKEYDKNWKKKQRELNTQYAESQRKILRDRYAVKKNDRDWFESENRRKRNYQRKRYSEDPEYRKKEIERSRLFALNNPTKMKELNRKAVLKKKYRRKNDLEYREKLNKQSRENYHKRMNDFIFRAKRNMKANRRSLRVKKCTPVWLNKEMEVEIQKIYEHSHYLSEITGRKYEVDHIFPIFGVDENGNHISSGLHVPWNLEPLEMSENRSKGNKIIKSDSNDTEK